MELPDRDALTSALAEMLEAPSSAAADANLRRGERPRPGVYVIAVDGHDRLVELDAAGAPGAMLEVARRLDRLVRSSDVLARIAPDRFALATASIAPAVAGAVIERIEGAAALPLDLGGEPVSLSVTVGVAFATRRITAGDLLSRAESDVERIRSR